MTQLGIGAMLHHLGGNAETVAAYNAALGKGIASLKVDDRGDGELQMRFTDGTGVRFYDDGRSCCESRYMRTDDDLDYHKGAALVGVELRDGPTTREEDEYGDVQEIQFLVVTTSKGTFTCASHNDHNGYYGGICLSVAALPTEEVR